ncbi:MAG: isopenicillin N synthase-like dioxygenase [Candidatus Azotimanducaceae bacterium]
MNLTTIDYAALSEPSELARLKQACERDGFFALKNHGLDTQRRTTFISQMATYFSQSRASKRQHERTAENPFGFYDKELTKNRPDWKEVFDISLSPATPTNWPSDQSFQDVTTDWSASCHHVAIRLLEAIFKTFNQSYHAPDFGPQHTSFLRLNYYPPCPNLSAGSADNVNEDILGVSQHTDAGALTLLQQDDTEGLQFLVDDEWQTTPAEPSQLCVNLGDMLQVWTNDLYRAPLHRVLANADMPRYSAPYFLNPSYSCDCTPLIGENPLYKTINWGEFRRRRADGDYADYGDEVQINQYRIQQD